MSRFNQWDERRYVPDAFSGFKATRDLDLGTARGLMWASQLVYEFDIGMSADSTNKVKRIVARWVLDYLDTPPVPGFPPDVLRLLPLLSPIARAALVIKRGDALIAAFCGTDPPRPQDWLVNFAALAGAGGASMGFADVAAKFAPLVEAHATGNPGLKLFLAGHSLGGAIAVAVASILDQKGINVEAVHTFGMPRAGDLTFRDDYNRRLGDRTYRFVHGDDLVPTVPPATLGPFRHFHVGSLIRCETGGKFALAQKSTDLRSNEPERDKDIATDLVAPAGLFGRGLTALQTLFGGGNVVDASIASLPPHVRHHLQDQYIAALTR